MNNPKIVGMVHIKGVNDKEFAEFIKNQSKSKPEVMLSIVKNRW